MSLSKNINVLRLAGLLTEAEALRQQGLLVEQDPTGAPPMGGAPEGPGGPPAEVPGPGGLPAEDKPEDPATLLDQAIELLNKAKESMSGGDKGPEAGPPPGQGF